MHAHELRITGLFGVRQEASARRRRWLVGVTIIALVGILQLTAQILTGRERGVLAHTYLFVLGTPLILAALSSAFARAERRQTSPLVMLVSSIVIASALGAGLALVLRLVVPHGIHRYNSDLRFERSILFGMVFGLSCLGLWGLAFVLPSAIEAQRVRLLETDKLRLETEALRLEADKLRTASELARLRAHLEPHFLLNTLNAISGLVTEDPAQARNLVGCLGDLLRDALREEHETQTLDAQIAWLVRYASILEARHGGGLHFRWEIADETRALALPALLLQPLVENAVKHGALKRAEGGGVVVRTALALGADGRRAKLVCTVSDDGPGMPRGAIRDGAIGLYTVRRRLELAYGGAAHLRLESSPSGTHAIVELPGPDSAARSS